VTTTDPGLRERFERVTAEVADAVDAAGRDPGEITTIVVTKFHPASLVRGLYDLGVREVGENRHQDAEPKAAELRDLELRWHFIGQLQTNKVRAVMAYASDIQSVDRDSLVSAMAATGTPIDAFIQLNLTDDANRGGVLPANLAALVERVLEAGTIRLKGLMAVAPLGDEPRRAFERVRLASEGMRTIAPTATALSMGMSGDFREAILEGATHLRIGTAITGNRPAHA
jgi:pyridoxal phosphate enzyme (YggS family)